MDGEGVWLCGRGGVGEVPRDCRVAAGGTGPVDDDELQKLQSWQGP
jgi:hypothetical protein